MVRVRAPELSATFPWLNSDRPLSLQDLRGQVVLLDFWTYGCINCLHVIPDIKYLESRYGDRLIVIGVHTAKFDHEQDPVSIQQAIARYGITHPVIVDQQRQLWQQYTVRAWPTLVVIDSQGYVAGTFTGEGHRQRLDTFIEHLLTQQESSDPLSLDQPFQAPILPTTPLAFPGNVLANETLDLLCIADTGHHRLVLTTLDGTLNAVVETGRAGWEDGAGAIAQFSSPQGLALDVDQQYLYVADTGNHLIRQVDLRRGFVSTIAGTGAQSRYLFPHGGEARTTALNSPWGLAWVDQQLFVAMAGSHQIWLMDLKTHTMQTFIGTGAEFCVDGLTDQAAFAQPSGLATDGQTLFVADSESSSIRAIALAPAPVVQTVCGSGQLFGFGDRDGVGDQVQLQHCLGITCLPPWLWVADTYNHKIKQIDVRTGQCQTWVGGDQMGHQDGIGDAAWFAEPSGISATSQAIYVADTNNHAVRYIDRQSRRVTTLHIAALCSPVVCN